MRELRLSNGVTLIDDEDYPFVTELGGWYLKRYGTRGLLYVVRKTSRKKHPEHKQSQQSLHRLLMGLCPGDPRMVDHINGNTLDNRRCNLRICTQAENNRNLLLRKNNKSGYKGVRWYKKTKRWVVTIQHNKKLRHLGYFKNIEDAKEAYNTAARELFGAFARLN